ncbi:tRNA (guanosine(37)-N1)-methyltransferase TrmD [Calderihabitans maritimus]|uniref:tRNA (guanine-N(1)-)-methyltransferase n=1 Tax=Calderihabitans maritimus TaxID=1246530 RepID=A0A1Z5HU09_9FIRM|nr:tRNA (guanosine(37)-N1)-methyltransferase TrmD [Calderihabitans maritimus]GAW92827.1 tRNA (guanine-N1)-methyltransferase [Calderihabitans maritimus]
MRIDILTIFPEMFQGPLQTSIIGKAQEKGLLEINLVNIRDYALDKHKSVDDYPYGGGAGMVMKPEPIFRAVEAIRGEDFYPQCRTILLSPQGELFNQEKAQELAASSRLILICGRYEGFDERIRQHLVTDELSIGDYILTGGELPAMVVVDAVSRLIPGVLGDEESAREESFTFGLLEYPQYTRPKEFRGYSVPEVLLSGHHQRIRRWRRKEALRRTWLRRPDLLAKATLTEEDHLLLEEIKQEHGQEE